MGLAEVRTMPLSLSDSPHHELIYTPGHHCDFKKHARAFCCRGPELHCKICDTCVYQASCHCVQSSSSCCTLPLCI